MFKLPEAPFFARLDFLLERGMREPQRAAYVERWARAPEEWELTRPVGGETAIWYLEYGSGEWRRSHFVRYKRMDIPMTATALSITQASATLEQWGDTVTIEDQTLMFWSMPITDFQLSDEQRQHLQLGVWPEKPE